MPAITGSSARTSSALSTEISGRRLIPSVWRCPRSRFLSPPPEAQRHLHIHAALLAIGRTARQPAHPAHNVDHERHELADDRKASDRVHRLFCVCPSPDRPTRLRNSSLQLQALFPPSPQLSIAVADHSQDRRSAKGSAVRSGDRNGRPRSNRARSPTSSVPGRVGGVPTEVSASATQATPAPTARLTDHRILL